uniref:Integrase catalytic domain-containing protein n=1 Tax=Tanacetum cinerariifolium TaxID=118510 RepID=A0A6L2J441_TANCI|nr:hypothetical protein [Tanacetum cinerariifolium]
MSYLSDFEELNGGYVAFGGNPKGGKIKRKGKIKTGKLDFDDVYFVKELKVNLFSVSQMCDKKNSVLFTNTKCLVLSSDFKLLDASQVLLKDETPPVLKTFIIGLENLLSLKVKIIRCDNGTEFKFFDLNQFRGLKGIKREFSVPRTPQQNGIAKRKNMTLIEAARTLLTDSLFLIPFWVEANFKGRLMKDFLLDTLCAVSGAQIRKQGDKTKNKDKGKSRVVTITGFRDLNEKFKECTNNSSNGVNAASSLVSTAVHNFINNTNDFTAAGPSNAAMPNVEDPTHSNDADDVGAEADINNLESIISVSLILTTRIHKDHPTSQIIGDLSSTTQTRSMARVVRDQEGNGTKWVYKNKKDEGGIVIRNKARLVDQGHTQEEGIDYKKVFTIVARIEAIRLFLAYASFMGILVYQMDVKSAFLYGTIEEEVYVCQPPGFEDPENPDKVYKVVKALYGLHQAPRACLQVKQKKDEIFVSQDKYVAEILKKFGLSERKLASTPIDAEKPLLKDSDGKDVDVHTYRSMIGSLMYLTSPKPDIMFLVCVCARFQVTPKVSHLNAVKRIFRYLKGKPYLGIWYLKDLPFDLVAYSDSDYAGASLDKKSTIKGCQFLRCRLISWQCKKQTVVATSLTEAEYVAAASGCAKCCGSKTSY